MKILVINAGSSSLKYQLFDMENEAVMAKGLCERIGINGSVLTHKPTGSEPVKYVEDMPDHVAAIKLVFKALTASNGGVIKDMSEINAVGHRVLHGGDKFSESIVIDEKVKAAIRECIPLGPLHNPANLMGIEACEKIMPDVPQVAVFDTAFHQTMPPKAYMYAIPYEYYEKYKIRRYGFHGTSHRFISARTLELLGHPENARVITCHLGNGSSIAAIKDGKCVDTSMGLTPLEGLPMGTRSGSIDPAIVGIISENEKLSAAEVVSILNKQSGVLAISGVSSDFRDIEDAVAKGNERAKLALEMFEYEIVKYVGSYIAALGGLDALVFAGGIGENGPETRESIVNQLHTFGLKIDAEKNKARGKEVDITGEGSSAKIFIVPTNEELMIARDTKNLIAAR
ncbi:MAG TPA: acetate kinase [Clostridiales bacterium]|jgi:acetate kinase|nr:acetate kinase [Clostridiales bacterium]